MNTLKAEYHETTYESLATLEVPAIGNPHLEQLLIQDAALVSDNVYADPLLKRWCISAIRFGSNQ